MLRTTSIDLDATRRHIVRMRGYFAVVGGPKPKFDILREAGLHGVAYVEAWALVEKRL